MARSIPKWFEEWAKDAVEQWKHDGRWYIIRHAEGSKFQWFLDYMDLDGMGGGGAPFRTREELDEYVRTYRLRPYEQLTLGI
ncbi:hypothetical protein GCM10025857_15210 [Alicyclobacillus contaminans]|uniref:hypothetical protein n=1 Tax=Alicyclobacillus contaminans TaxID=392016 RepID=UPI0004057BCB|nr:hypothetical protein [Alicyclobacillus contaminans]GMA50164.1 hypothetical protein GCM10025857_15210 [Alicyclobacillus contaminans]